MKKIIPILVIGLLLSFGFNAFAITEVDENLSKYTNLILSIPILEKTDEYIKINLKEATSINIETGKPMLPVVTKIYTFPLGTIINDIDVTFSGVKEYVLSKKIEPAPEPVPLTSMNVLSKHVSEDVLDEEVYTSYDLYPEERYTVRKGVGLNGDEHAVYVTVRCNPIQYSPAKDTIYASQKIDINIEYQPPDNPVVFPDVYDMVIITSEKFQAKAQELADHKNTLGIETTVKTVEDILSDSKYDVGRDDAEKIKLFIKDALDDWGIHYVLLFGGRKGQTLQWDIPDRRSNCDDDSEWETGYSSDLYFADIYKEGLVFDDWDSNKNNIFAEFKFPIKDVMDYIPDVAIGRIPVRTQRNAKIVVDKIIKYETTKLSAWINNAFVISGDTVPPVRFPWAKEGVYEGELVTNISANLLENIGFSVQRLWTSNGGFNNSKDVRYAFRMGAGLIHLEGHGNPAYWGNFPPEAESETDLISGLGLQTMEQLNNGDMLPVVVVGGCHNAQFNVTLKNLFAGILRDGIRYFNISYPYGGWWTREWVPFDWASRLLMLKDGGSIANIGNTGLGWGSPDELYIEDLSGWIEPRFFDAYANQSKETVGDAHCQAITDYVNIIGGVNSGSHHRKTIEEWALIGDPSLKICGY